MANARKYFLRSGDGQKGPYTRKQMKASIQAKTLSKKAEYRTGEDEEWQPIQRLIDDIAREDAEKRPARPAASPGPSVDGRLPGVQGAAAPKRANPLLLLLLVPLGAYLLWMKVGARDAMGTPCKNPEDCPSGGTCLLEVADDRTIQPGGYCTFPCSDSGQCKSGMFCGDAVEMAGPQGARWDGMFKKNTRMCMKR